jgi:hypothetical protein
MRTQDKWIFFLFGLVFWALGTLGYEMIGPAVFETGARRYWVNFVLTPIASAAVCILLLAMRHIPAPQWAAASLLISIPGMFGEAVVLSRFGVLMPRMHAETGGRYGALLFASYGVFLAIAEFVTIAA